MHFFSEAWARLFSSFRKQELDREFDEELAVHVELATEDHLRQGMSLPEARRLARIKLGGMELSKEVHRESRGLPWLDGIVHDVRYAIHNLRRSPGFALTAVATLAVAIGVNAGVVTLTNAVLFKGFPLVDRNDRTLYLSTGRGCCVSYPDFEDWRTQAKSFQGMAIVHGSQKNFSDGLGFAEIFNTTEVSADTFRLAGQKPILGRDFLPSDEIRGAAPVAILRYSLWEHRYGKDPAIVGRTVRINDYPTTVIGVMPKGFGFPQNAELWVPLVRTADVLKRENRGQWFVFARLADGVTVESARAEMDTIGRRLGGTYPLTNQGRNLLPQVQRFHEFFIGPNASMIYNAMLGAVVFVLLIACANLANLLLARAISRTREIRVRLALGAGRWRIIRQLLIESVILSVLGGFFGWWIAKLGVRVFALTATGASLSDNILGNWFDNTLDYTMDYRIFGYLVAISIATGLLFGIAPAARLSKLDINATLKDGGRGSTGAGRGKYLSSLLVVGEMALAIVLLAGAGVMLRSFLNIYTADLGIDSKNVLTAAFDLPSAGYPNAEAQISFFERLKTRVEGLPDVESVAFANALPTARLGRSAFELANASSVSIQKDEQNLPTTSTLIVSPAYFGTLAAPLLSGRDFNDFDTVSRPPAAIVNRRFASEYWPGEDPVGRRLRLFAGKTPGPWLTIVGVAPNIAQNDSTRQKIDNPLVYLPQRQNPRASMWIIARTRVNPITLASTFRREVQAIDPNLPTTLGPYSLADYLADGYRYRGTTGVLFLSFAATALLLASIGLYAVIAHSVNQRTQEIGVRMALGGRAEDIRRLVLREGMIPIGIGLGLGLMGSFALNRLLIAQLVGVSPADPTTYIVASALLVLSALLGCLVPASRAMRVDPIVALRHD